MNYFPPMDLPGMQCEGIEKIMDAKPGSQSISTTHQLFKDRDKLILVTESTRKSFNRYYLDGPEKQLFPSLSHGCGGH